MSRRETGVVTYTKLSDDFSSGFGFIEPEAAGLSVFFSSNALRRAGHAGDVVHVERGDIVEFTRNPTPNAKGPTANCVWMKVKLHVGEDSTT
jgi:cold shock CspA family protein